MTQLLSYAYYYRLRWLKSIVKQSFTFLLFPFHLIKHLPYRMFVLYFLFVNHNCALFFFSIKLIEARDLFSLYKCLLVGIRVNKEKKKRLLVYSFFIWNYVLDAIATRNLITAFSCIRSHTCWFVCFYFIFFFTVQCGKCTVCMASKTPN